MQPENENNPRAQVVRPASQTQAQSPSSSVPPARPVNSLNHTTPSNKKKRLFIGIIALSVLILGTTAGAYFGIYVPNKPENVWKKALDNSSKGYDKLVDYGEEQKNNKGGTIKGNFKLDADQLVVDGSLDTKYYEKNSVTKLDAGAAGTRFNLDLLTNVPANTKNPDIYVKLSGLKGLDALLGAEGAGAGQAFASFDNQWFVIDHTLIDQIEKAAAKSGESQPTLPTLTQEDFASIARSAGNVNREYLFTDNQDKAVFKRVQNVGKEKLDDRNAYHYKVGYNKDNLKSYLNALKDEMKKTKLKDYIDDKQFDDAIKSVDELDGNAEADAWVDLKTKLVRKVRFTDKDQKDSYVDVGLRYNGGDEYPFFVDVISKDDKSEGKFTIGATLNTKDNNAKFNVNVDGKENGQPIKFNFDATLTPGNDKVDFKKPDNAKSLLEAVSQLFGGEIDPAALLQSSAQDDAEL